MINCSCRLQLAIFVSLIALQAARNELLRVQQVFQHCAETAGYKGPSWATAKALKTALTEKSPWLAGWDRFIRMMLRLQDLGGQGAATQGFVEDLFIK